MTCFRPLTGYQRYAGSPLSFRIPSMLAKRVVVPCGQCSGCRLDKSASMAARCMHEASLYKHNQFVTLTYKSSPMTLVPDDFQKFLRRLRKIQPFRFFGCGEYGDAYGRPHYHVLLFNFPCVDKYYWRMSDSGFRLYRSPGLEHVWRHGFVEIGDVTFESAAYVARYAMKKQIGKDAGKVREILDVETGEVVTREHEFARMSLKPGIGSAWYDKYWKDVYPAGKVVFRGGKSRNAPKYYDSKYKLTFPVEYERLAAERLRLSDGKFDEYSPSRLRVKEIVQKAKLSFLKRGL